MSATSSAQELVRPAHLNSRGAARPATPQPGEQPQQKPARQAPPSIAKPALQPHRKESWATNSFLALSAVAVAYGYSQRGTENIVPYEGTGYWLGVFGGTLLLLQLIYSACKRMAWARGISSSRAVFQLHVLVGLLGPVAILYHSNFSLGATNSNVALFTMLVVVASGLVGRFLYSRVHRGFYGAQITATASLGDAVLHLRHIEAETGGSNGRIALLLSKFAEKTLARRPSFFGQAMAAFVMPFKVRSTRLRFASLIRKTINENAIENGWTATEKRRHRSAAQSHVNAFLTTVSDAARLGFWEKLVAHWHIFHVPLFYLLVGAAVAHVIAVHWY